MADENTEWRSKEPLSHVHELTITVEQSISIYTIYRQYLIHEDDLVNQRTTWSITIQGFIVVAFGMAFQNKMNIGVSVVYQEYNALILAFATLGLGVSLTCLFSVRAAQMAIRGLSTRWKLRHEKHPSSHHYPPLTGGGEYWATHLGHILPIVLQGFFVSFWILVIVLQISFKAGLFGSSP